MQKLSQNLKIDAKIDAKIKNEVKIKVKVESCCKKEAHLKRCLNHKTNCPKLLPIPNKKILVNNTIDYSKLLSFRNTKQDNENT